MLIDILGYRDWAQKVATVVTAQKQDSNHYVHYHNDIDELCSSADLTFAVGWSNLIPDSFMERTILIVHPSPLPKYRGGSPIQHQMLQGESVSAVTIFKLEPGRTLDSGPIAWQMSYSLSGSLNEIFKRISWTTIQGINACINCYSVNELVFFEQDESAATTFKRRSEWESEISRDEMTSKPAWWLEAKIRMLADPYPNAFITCADGEKLYITGAKL